MSRAPLFGRDEDLARLDAMISDRGTSLVTLTGPAGVGKTSLASAYLEKRADEGDEGVRLAFCDASGCHRPLELCAQLAHALGVPAPGEVEIARASSLVEASLLAEPTLVVIDNFEQLADSCSSLLAAWQAAATELDVLVTSRRRLGLDAERVMELEPLSIAENADQVEACPAAELFLTRLQEQNSAFSLVPDEKERLRQLLERLDGLPLAIELAASRGDVLSIEELEHRMADRFSLLRRGDASLEATLEASWALLSPSERSGLAQCSIFRGGFTVEAAELVIDVPGEEVIDLLQRLRSHSLIAQSRIGAGRQRLKLLDSVREFAAARLEDGFSVEERHARWCADLARRVASQVLGRDIVEGFRRYVDERENLLSALDRCIERRLPEASVQGLAIAAGIAATCGYAGGRAELTWRIERLLDDTPSERFDPRLVAEVASYAGWYLSRGPTFDRASQMAERALEAAEAAGCRDAVAAAQRLQSGLLAQRGQVPAAIALVEQGLEALAEHEIAAATLHDQLGDLLRQSGRQVEARRHAERALELLRANDCSIHQVNATLTLGFIHIEQGDLELAERRVHRGTELLESFSSHTSRARLALQLALGRIAHGGGDLDRAISIYGRLQKMSAAAQMRVMHAYVSASVGTALAERGDLAEACEHLREALVALPHVDVQYGALFQGVLAAIEALRGHADESRLLQAAAEDALRGSAGPLAMAVGACRALVDLGRREDGSESSRSRAAEQLRELEAFIEQAPARIVLELRLITRLLRAGGIDAAPPDSDVATLEVEAEGRWFVPPRGARIRCGRRPIMRRMLVALVEARIRAPGRALDRTELLEVGWPGERMIETAAKRRVQVMMSRMRELGLRGVLQTTDAGYRIDPRCVVYLRD